MTTQSLLFGGASLTTTTTRCFPFNKITPYPEQESEELGDEVIARLNPKTGEIEDLEVLFFSTRLLRSDLFELPITAELRLAAKN